MGRILTATVVGAGLLSDAQHHLACQAHIVPCEPVNTQLDGSLVPCTESPIGFCAMGTVSAGVLKGSKNAVYLGASLSAGMPQVEAPSTLSYSAAQVFHTEKGDLYMSVVGVSDNAAQAFTELARITGGTGRFANATGKLFISGTLTPDGIGFQSKVTGQICFDGISPQAAEATTLKPQ